MHSSPLTLFLTLSLLAPFAAAQDGSATHRAVARARDEVSRAVTYDAGWARIPYPMGDVDASHGACTDLVVRAERAAGLDLQAAVHEDILRAPSAYRAYVTTTDASIDHRRVGPLLVYLRRHARSLPFDREYAAGDILVISFDACPHCGPQHIGIVSDRVGPRGVPLLLHNMGPTAREDDTLDAWAHLGHFRLR